MISYREHSVTRQNGPDCQYSGQRCHYSTLDSSIYNIAAVAASLLNSSFKIDRFTKDNASLFFRFLADCHARAEPLPPLTEGHYAHYCRSVTLKRYCHGVCIADLIQ